METAHQPETWEAFADALLRAAALRARVGKGDPSHDFAGLYIGDDEVDRILIDIPGIAENDRLGPDVAAVIDTDVFDHRVALHADDAVGPAFHRIVWNAGLRGEEVEVFAVLGAVELSPRRQRLVAYLNDNVAAPRLTPALLRRLFPVPHLGPLAVGSASALRVAELVSVDGGPPWAVAPIRVAAAVAWTLAGDVALDPDLPKDTRVVIPEDLDPSGAGFVAVAGGDATSRRLAAYEKTAGFGFVVTPMPESYDEWAAVVREATISGLGIILEAGAAAELDPDARYWIGRCRHLAWAVSTRSELAVESLPDRPWIDIHLNEAEATPDEWEIALGIGPTGGHRLDREQLRLVSRAFAAVDGSIDGAVRRIASGKLDRLALRIRPRRTWSDLVLPPDQMSQLRELTARYRHRDTVYEAWGFLAAPSAGLVALFSGPSGTGKTLTAEIIAGDLGLDVYKVDLSAVVSKYIGETEKNLESIFSAASAGNVVLFFDEADSLFGKRSEVSDAHDRYANIEVSYLLQRLERYDGMVVLATNLQKNIDQAFLRRIHIAVEFPMPEVDERRAIWKLSFPPGAPIGDVDFEFLAERFKVSGGSVRNAALNAAFLAAEAGQPISMEIVIYGLKREFQKLGRLLTESEFDRFFELVKGGAHAATAR